MDEQIAREKILTRIALGNAANSLKRVKQPSHKSSNQNSRGKSNNKTTHASAHAASYEKTFLNSSSVITAVKKVISLQNVPTLSNKKGQ